MAPFADNLVQDVERFSCIALLDQGGNMAGEVIGKRGPEGDSLMPDADQCCAANPLKRIVSFDLDLTQTIPGNDADIAVEHDLI